MSIVWLLLLLVPLFLYLALMERRDKKREKKFVEHLKEEASGSPEKLRLIEIYEIETNLVNKITDKMFCILSDEGKDDFYAGAFKEDYKPGKEELSECLLEYGYQPNMFDDKVSNMVKKLAHDPDLAFLLKHGVRKEAQLRHQLKLKTKELDKEK
ncbi:MAG: hypothetical protein PHY02_04240 [Phycisphaerae bacterium]|nr:hypothetical protein [Phycisphaerae bacterium]